METKNKLVTKKYIIKVIIISLLLMLPIKNVNNKTFVDFISETVQENSKTILENTGVLKNTFTEFQGLVSKEYIGPVTGSIIEEAKKKIFESITHITRHYLK